MSYQRVCSGCKWVYPTNFHGIICKFCKTALDTFWCYNCLQFKTKDEFSWYKRPVIRPSIHCKACHYSLYSVYTKEYTAAQRVIAEEFVDKWLRNDKLIFKPMSEQEWVRTCTFFGGCAICADAHIETREFLLPFKHGGRYAPWNMIPMCGTCAIAPRQTENPFIWLRKNGYAAKKLGLTDERRNLIQNYLIQRVSERLEQQDNGI